MNQVRKISITIVLTAYNNYLDICKEVLDENTDKYVCQGAEYEIYSTESDECQCIC